MTPKEQYEARKAARHAARHAPVSVSDDEDPGIEIVDILDRIATALERIAVALEPTNEVDE